ncbi:MAG TPA: ribosome-associated translation inhibitor RaiA [Acetobacteraceae bacterium]|nr:ribosome-associated translation inhibitor RaiA [Acetobacteraceae bacterium]
MQINVSGKQVDLSDALRTRVAASLDGIAGKYFDHAMEAHVTFGRARSFFTCDINLHASRGLTLRGEGEAADAHSAFDDAAEHIATRLRRYRRRLNDHHRDTAQRERPEKARTFVLRAEGDEGEAPAVNGHAQPAYATVIAETQIEIARLTVGDAVMRMDLADQKVLMFRNSGTGELNVIYRRADGNIGWIDPTIQG